MSDPTQSALGDVLQGQGQDAAESKEFKRSVQRDYLDTIPQDRDVTLALERLAQLHEKGILTVAEFELEKKRILQA